MKKFKKGSASKTRKGEKDFTTKKTSKDFDRGGKRFQTAQGSKVVRSPFRDKKTNPLERAKRSHNKKDCGCGCHLNFV
jgi:hypothetical protein